MNKYILNLTADERAGLAEVYPKKRISALVSGATSKPASATRRSSCVVRGGYPKIRMPTHRRKSMGRALAGELTQVSRPI